MNRKKPNNANRGGVGSPTVHLEFRHPTATAVCIAGTFNEWRPEATPMVPLGNGRWIKTLALPPGQYEYRLVVDGNWMCDPSSKEATPNPFGEFNSVLKVENNDTQREA